MKCLMPVRMYCTMSDKGHKLYSHSSVKGSTGSIMHRPCGNCMNCKLSKATDWALRMSHEAKFHSQNSFLTLTYSPEHLPPNGSLDYNDVTGFIKRLRRRLDRTIYKSSLSFYRVGEYGSDFSRPHYHLVLFGYDFTEKLKYHGVINEVKVSSKKDDRRYYKSTFATDLWDKGFVDIGSVNYSTCMYTAKYVTKRLNSFQSDLYNDLVPEKASMSKKIPIGLRWIEKYYEDVYPHDFVIHEGTPYPPPKFYDKWLEKNKPSLYEKVKTQRENSLVDLFPDYERLYAAHIIRRQKQKAFLRDGCAPNLSLDDVLIEEKRLMIKQQKDSL